MVYSQVFIGSEIFEWLRSSGYTPSASLRSAAPSEREPGGARTIQPAAQKPQHCGRFSSPLRKLREFDIVPLIEVHSLSEVKNAPHSRQEKPIDKTLCTCYNTWELTEKFPISYRGVEQLEARRAHNPEVVGSSPASATKIIPDFDKKSGIFRTFVTILPRPQIHFGDSLGIAQNQGWEKPYFLRKKRNGLFLPLFQMFLNPIQ